MQESTLFKISLTLSIIGILVLLFVSEKKDADLVTIEEALNSSIGQKVKIKGQLTTIINSPGFLILNIKDNTGEIKAIAFIEEEIRIFPNSTVKVEGQIKEYKNEKEIEVSSITTL